MEETGDNIVRDTYILRVHLFFERIWGFQLSLVGMTYATNMSLSNHIGNWFPTHHIHKCVSAKHLSNYTSTYNWHLVNVFWRKIKYCASSYTSCIRGESGCFYHISVWNSLLFECYNKRFSSIVKQLCNLVVVQHLTSNVCVYRSQ